MPIRYLADTHILHWVLVDDPKLPARHRRLIASLSAAGEPLGISAISLWEIAKLVERGRLLLTTPVEDYLLDIERSPAIEVLPVDARVSAESTRLGPTFHRDPADPIIAASARIHGLTLLTVDELIIGSKVCRIG